MKRQNVVTTTDKKKIVAITFLFVMSVIIIFIGALLGISSIVNNVSFKVLNSNIHGAVFGAVIMFLGVRYFLSVQRLKTEVYKNSSKFSWSNFKKAKPFSILSKNR